jgi:hypothetical protein
MMKAQQMPSYGAINNLVWVKQPQFTAGQPDDDQLFSR